jgi:hypothetical protein
MRRGAAVMLTRHLLERLVLMGALAGPLAFGVSAFV